MEYIIKRLPELALIYPDTLQRVNIKGIISYTHELSCGVPQGSVLRPMLYCLYTKPVLDIIRRFGLLHHS